MRLKMFLTCVFLGAACFGSLSIAQSTEPKRADIIRLIGQMPEFSQTREQLIRQGFRGENLAVAEEHARLILNDPAIAGYMADRVLALYSGNLPAESAAEGLIGPLYVSGITHLPEKELAYFYRVQRALMDGMSTRLCGLMVKQRLSARKLDEVMAQAEARLSTKTLKSYYRIQRKVLRLGVNRGPQRLSPSEEARIQAVISKLVEKRISDAANARSLKRAFENLDRATNAVACQAGKMISDAVLELKGRDLRHALLYLSAP